jgi:hydroxymethylpyrimidine/phosphomethylpyrimidine kinase
MENYNALVKSIDVLAAVEQPYDNRSSADWNAAMRRFYNVFPYPGRPLLVLPQVEQMALSHVGFASLLARGEQEWARKAWRCFHPGARSARGSSASLRSRADAQLVRQVIEAASMSTEPKKLLLAGCGTDEAVLYGALHPEAQIDAVFLDIGVDIVKIGMLASPEIVRTVASALKRHGAKRIILDPVLRATSGASLGGDDTAQAMIAVLFPMASLVTPNLEEADLLLGRQLTSPEDFKFAAEELLEMGPQAVLIKGGHLDNTHTQLTDFLMWRTLEDGLEVVQSKEFKHHRVNTTNTHGTGCSLASAIATYLASGHDLPHSVAKAISYVEAGLEAGRFLSIGEGPGPLWHMHDFYPTALPEEKSKL